MNKKRFFFVVLVSCFIGIQSASAEEHELCPRGEYHAIQWNDNVTLFARVTLPKTGYEVRFERRPEKIIPPFHNFVCEPPQVGGAMMETRIVKSEPVYGQFEGDTFRVLDSRGWVDVPVSLAIPIPDPLADLAEFNADGPVFPHCGGRQQLECKADGDFCSKPVGTCEFAAQEGLCVEKPQICNEKYDPVCGCDYVTYSNACKAAEAGVNVFYAGECREGDSR